MIPMNFGAADGKSTFDYILTGSWGKYAAQEAAKFGEVRTVWDGKPTNYDRLPKQADLKLDPQAAYAYYVSNETIHGVEFQTEPQTGKVPLVCDASSDFLSRPVDIKKYGLFYACAQKNAGPAGVTVVVVRKDLLERSRDSLPGYLNFKIHAEAESLWNTAPTFAIYVLMLVTKWLLTDVGGLDKMLERNRKKAKLLYDAIDSSGGFYAGHAQTDCRSLMNVTFRLPSDELTDKFVKGAKELGLSDLKGHRSVGGIRASIYNAMPVAGVEKLRTFMDDFAAANK
jgi:phosphoserine aminotransferase